jgi:hypothetical protein
LPWHYATGSTLVEEEEGLKKKRVYFLYIKRGVKEEEEGLQGVFKRLRRNGYQLEKGLQMAQRWPSLK